MLKNQPNTESAMTQITIPAQVVNGHLQHEKNLTELEGEHVLATLAVVPKEGANGASSPVSPKPEESAEFDPEPPEWLEIEHDVYFPIKVPKIPLGKVTVRVREGKPCIILPEELPDD
jgi:hypothetical protein